MRLIGTTRLDALDWLQEQLKNSGRPRVEATFHGLLARGLITENGSEVMLAETVTGDHIYAMAAQQDVEMTNNKRARMRRRHNSPTYKKPIIHLHQGNTIDCSTDEIYN